jgi:hypothetical protein
VTLFGVDETILWQQQTTATTIELPAAIRGQLHGGVSYLWRVEARSPTGGRMAASELTRIEIANGAEEIDVEASADGTVAPLGGTQAGASTVAHNDSSAEDAA